VSQTPAQAREGVATVAAAALVYGGVGPGFADPAEEFHEASKITPAGHDPLLPGLRLLESNVPLRASAGRAVKRHPGVPSLELPAPPPSPLLDLLRRRRSRRSFGRLPIDAVALAALLEAAYGVTATTADPPQAFRTTPSGGALYPLDVFPVVERVDGIAPGTYHYDPLRVRLELLRSGSAARELERCTPYPSLFGDAAVVLLAAATFWRTRFKYGVRGYRFALIEAGHLAQNVLLEATARGLAAVPVGGFFDARIDDFLELDGVDESTVYAIAVGREDGR
jgi:SagB-type dehydrogenase family enzyme